LGAVINALILGDVIGQPGCRALFIHLKELIKDYSADFVVVNGENAADGFGITPEIMQQFYSNGIDVITTGNHIWQRREILSHLELNDKLLRPENYPPGVVGKGFCIIEKQGIKLGVLNLQGRTRLSEVDCPFRIGDRAVKKIKKETDCIIVDFHAEAPEEKESLAIYFDGKISALAGTHTHVQTADERIMDGGTAYMTDIGMIGPTDSVIGFDKRIAIQRSTTQLPLKMEVADNPAVIQGVCVSIDSETGKAIKIVRINKISNL